MPKSLSDVTVRNAKPRSKSYKVADGEGLFLLIMPNGSKYWRLKYFFAGKEKLLALGVYPDVTLAEARDRRGQARKVLAAGNDPGAQRKHQLRRFERDGFAAAFDRHFPLLRGLVKARFFAKKPTDPPRTSDKAI